MRKAHIFYNDVPSPVGCAFDKDEGLHGARWRGAAVAGAIWIPSCG